MIFYNNVFVLYNKITLEILFVQEPLHLSITPEQFLQERYSVEKKCLGYSIDDFGVIVSDRESYREVLANIDSYYIRVNADASNIEYVLKKQEVSNMTYNDQSVKRYFTPEQVLEMYNEDYINFTLKNIIKGGGYVSARFIPLKDINIYVHSLDKNWSYFHNDQFLTDSDTDKRLLGQDIYENGTYWPVVVAPLVNDTSGNLYCFEGTHRVVSLKLNQLEGRIPEDFKILCLCYSDNYEVMLSARRFISLKTPLRVRSVVEVLYGNNVIISDDAYKEAISTCIQDRGSVKNEYTLEWEARSVGDSIFAAQTYPHWLRDLIYPIRNIVKPSRVLNNETLFQEWLSE